MELFIYFLISFIQPIMLPTPEALAIVAASQKFGSFKAFIVGYLGIILGATFIYIISYYGLSKIFYKYINKNKIDNFINNNDLNNKIFLFGLFIFPVLPDDIICISSGITKLNIKPFITTLLFSKLLTTIIYAYFFDLYNSINKIYFILGLSIFITLYLLFNKHYKIFKV